MIQINCTTDNVNSPVVLRCSNGESATAIIESATRSIFKLSDSPSIRTGEFIDSNGNSLLSNFNIPTIPGSYEGPLLVGVSLVPSLSIVSDQFIDEHGKNYNWRGHIDWMLFYLSLNGVTIEPILSQRYSAGSRAVAFLCQAENIKHFHPSDYPQYFNHLEPFLIALKSAGFLAMPVVYADESQVKSGNSFVYRCAEVFANKPWVFPSLGNEFPNNGFSPSDFSKPAGNYWSRGSSTGDQAPYYPSWDWKEWHSRRDFPKVLFGNDDAWYVKQGTNGDLVTIDPRGLAPTIVTEPIGFWNQNVPNRRSNDPNLAWVVGSTSICFARGANFMSEAGLNCDMWDDVTFECAEQFFKAISARD